MPKNTKRKTVTKPALTVRRQIYTWARRVSDLKTLRNTLHRRVKELTDEMNELKAGIAYNQQTAHEFKAWNASQVDLQIVASGEPGLLVVTCTLRSPSATLTKTKDFHLINVCHSLPYMAPDTMKVWRENLSIATGILDKAITAGCHVAPRQTLP